jgi:hypothetical protein
MAAALIDEADASAVVRAANREVEARIVLAVRKAEEHSGQEVEEGRFAGFVRAEDGNKTRR